MPSLDMTSTQAITKFLRTNNDISEQLQLIGDLLEAQPILPRQCQFIAELLETRLNQELNTASKKNDSKKTLFFKQPQTWAQVITIIQLLVSRKVDPAERVSVSQAIKSIKLLQLLNLALEPSAFNPETVEKVAEAVTVALKHGFLNVAKTSSQSSQSIFGLYLSIASKSLLHEGPKLVPLLLDLYNFLIINGSIDPNISNRDLISVKNHQIKEVVKFNKDNSQFLVINFIENGLLARLLAFEGTKDRITQNFVNQLLHVFFKNSISPDVADADKLNFSHFYQHAELFVKKHSEISLHIAFYRYVVKEAISEIFAKGSSQNQEAFSTVNEKLINFLSISSKLSVEELVKTNIDLVACRNKTQKGASAVVAVTPSFVENLYQKELVKACDSHDTFNKASDSNLSQLSIKKSKLENVNFGLLCDLMTIENQYSKSVINCIDRFGFPILFLYLKGLDQEAGTLKQFESLIHQVIHYFSLTSHLYIKFFDYYRKLFYASNGNAKVLEILKKQIISKLPVLSITQLNKLVKGVLDQTVTETEVGTLETQFSVLSTIINYYNANPLKPDLIENSNNVLKQFFYKLVSEDAFSKYRALDSYNELVYEFLTLFSAEDLHSVAEFETCIEKFVLNGLDFDKVYQVLIVFRYVESYPQKLSVRKDFNFEKLVVTLSKKLPKLSQSVQEKYVTVIFLRFFNVFAAVLSPQTVKDFTLRVVNLSGNRKSIIGALDNKLIFEVPTISNALVEWCVSQFKAKKPENDAAPIAKKIPSECFSKSDRVLILDELTKSVTKSKKVNIVTEFEAIYDKLALINHLLLAPVYDCNLISSTIALFDLFKGYKSYLKDTTSANDKYTFYKLHQAYKLNESIVTKVISAHLNRIENKASKAYLDKLFAKLAKTLDESEVETPIFVTDIVARTTHSNNAEISAALSELRDSYAGYCASFIEKHLRSVKSGTARTFPFIIFADGLLRLSTEIVDFQLQNKVSRKTLKHFSSFVANEHAGEEYQKRDSLLLEAYAVSVLPILVSESELENFDLYYLTLYLSLSQETKGTDNLFFKTQKALILEEEVESSENIVQLGLFYYLRVLSESRYTLLLSFVLKSLADVSATIDGGNDGIALPLPLVEAVSIFIKVLKDRKNNFVHLDKKRFFATLVGKFLELFDAQKESKFYVHNEEEKVLVLAILANVITEENYLLNQYSFEQVFVLLMKFSMSQTTRHFSEPVYRGIVNFISKTLLLYRNRLSGRYHLLVSIFNVLMTPLTSSDLINSRYIQRATHLYCRAITNMCNPNDQAAKTLNSNHSSLTSNVNIIKSDLRQQVASIVLCFIRLSLTENFHASVKETIVHDAIFPVFDVLTEKEFAYINSSLDVAGRMFYKSIYEEYNQNGKWKE